MRHVTWFCLLLSMVLFTGGCSQGQAPEPPASYAIGEEDGESFPALQEAVSLPEEDMSFSESTDPDTEEMSYTYSGLESGSETVSQYVSALEEDESCSVVDENGMVQEETDLSADSGNVMVGREASEGGAMLLKITWDEDSCTISPAYDEEIQIRSASEPETQEMTLNEVIDRFESYTPEQLGLAGDKMSDYTVVPEEGYILVDETPGFRVNIYEKVSSRFAGTYLISSDGERVYSLDRATQEVSELALA